MRTAVHNILAIYRRELYGYFRSPLAYVITGIFWLVCGFLFTILLSDNIQLSAFADFQQQQGGEAAPTLDVPYDFLQRFLREVLGAISLLVLPLLSMGLYAEERKQGTLELLVTSPLSNWVIAVGKLLGVLTLFVTMVAPFLVFEAMAVTNSQPPLSPLIILMGHFALILQAAAILAVGMWISAWSSSSLVAGFGTFVLVTAGSNLDSLADRVGGSLGQFISNFAVVNHFYRLAGGVLDLGSLAILTSYTLLGIFLTAQTIEWRRRS
jgi:ABC-2 type transport system permease protein